MQLKTFWIILNLGAYCQGQFVDPETSTVNGHCDCESQCRASAHDHFISDWCPTKNACGFSVGQNSQLSHGKHIFWDYCQFKESKVNTSELSWKTKHDLMWNLMKEDQSPGAPNDFYALYSQSLTTSFESEWDFMPAGRVKYAHAQGIVCPIQIKISSDSPFTGLLRAKSSLKGHYMIFLPHLLHSSTCFVTAYRVHEVIRVY